MGGRIFDMVQIEEVAKAIGAVVSGPGQSIINDITHDSRQAKAGTIFVAITRSDR